MPHRRHHDSPPSPAAIATPPLYSLVRPLLFTLPPEKAHCAAMAALHLRAHLTLAASGGVLPPPPTAAPTQCMGLHFPNPVGLAAGFDKNAAHTDALSTLGFGFLEVGGVTPLPQPGTPPPRLFRLPRAQALINRMGFNNAGAQAVAANLRARRTRTPLGVNIGKNAATPPSAAADDYARCLRALYPHGDFFVLNISSPNTAGLRDLQQKDALAALLAATTRVRDRLATEHGKRAPLAIKLAPDLSDDALLAAAATAAQAGIDGIVAVNTTTQRPPELAADPASREPGGLSGRPLAARATAVIRLLRAALPAHMAVIGVGGIDSPTAAAEKLAAGATLVQLYTGLIYQGAALPARIIAHLRTHPPPAWQPPPPPPSPNLP